MLYNNRLLKRFFLFFLLLFACDQAPDGVLSQSKMADVLYDVHIVEGIMEEYPSQYRDLSEKQTLMAGVFEENNINKAQFDTSLVYYSKHLDKYMEVYEDVSSRLEVDRDTLAARLMRYERSLLSPVGDSVNLWRLPNQILFGDRLRRYASVFEFKGDSNYRADDIIEFNMHPVRIDSINPICFTFGYKTVGGSIVQHDTVLYAAEAFQFRMQVPILKNTDRLFGSVAVLNATPDQPMMYFIEDISIMRYRSPKKEEVDSIK